MSKLDPYGLLLEQLGPGVLGYTVESEDGALYIPMLEAERPGNGDVSRYLNSLPVNRTIKVPNVINGRLVAMLRRRGFELTTEWSEEFGEHIGVYVRAGSAREEQGT